EVLDFGFDHFTQRGFVLVGEFFRGKLRGFALDEFLGQRKLIGLDRGLLNVGEIAAGFTQLFGIAHGVGDHAGQFVIRRGGDRNEMFAAAKGNFSQCYFVGGLQGLADHREGLSLAVVLGNHEVWLLVVFGIDFLGIHKLRDFDRMLRRYAQVLDLVGFDHDVLTLAVLVALDNVVFLHGAFLAFAGDLLVPDALAGRSAELMEANLALRFGGGKEAHTEGDERNLYLTCPEGSRHGKFSKTNFYAAICGRSRVA